MNFHFCPNCGSSVYWSADIRPDQYGIAVGAFADPNFPLPAFSVWEESKHVGSNYQMVSSIFGRVALSRSRCAP